MRPAAFLLILAPVKALVPSHMQKKIIPISLQESQSVVTTGELEKNANLGVQHEPTKQKLSINDFQQDLNSFADEKDLISLDNGDNTVQSFPEYSSPAEYDNAKFQLDTYVQFWIDFNRHGLMETDEFQRTIVNVANRFSRKGNEALSYWLRHTSRTGYFFANAVLGVLASQLYDRLRSSDVPGNSFLANVSQPIVFSRMVAEVVLCYEQDYENIVQGKYKAPYDMYTINSQNNPLFIGRQTSMFVTEAVATMARRNRGSDEDKRIQIIDDKHNESSMYPDYYRTAFHYQTEGWMSEESANVYETSTETLFLGRQDAMQRTALVPLVEFSKNDGSYSKLGRPMKVLEIACGTGRFMTFVRDNLSLDTECTAVDLSPFYLQKAKENDERWRSLQTNKGIKPIKIVQAKGEKLPFTDGEFDVVICMYLYHEVPRDIRARISAEMSRVTKKGGRVILTDSLQKGDRPVMDDSMGNFEKMNEPYYRDYIEDVLPRHFEAVGLKCLTKCVRSSTKTLTFGKPI